MRDFFIRALDVIVGVLVVISTIGVALSGIIVLIAPAGLVPQGQGGFFPALAIWISGGLTVMITGGSLFLGLGIYDNTHRAAKALETLAAKA
ncbi:hypothetical protein [Rhodobacter lacus]|uniref:Uncharacterized protein n=1 Tax=Rhodobacter lacus TaxID=1641972 RepID=A0ABW5A544_9RHOB